MKILTELLEELFTLLFSSCKVLFNLFFPSKTPGYNAELMPASQMLKRHNRGWCLTGNRSLDGTKLSYQNALIVGPTGSGKSTIVIINSILKMNGSMVINDPSGEIRNAVSGYIHQVLKAKIIVIDYKNPKKSMSYNPLVYANTIGEIIQLAQTLVRASLKKSNDPFWELSAISLISVIIRFLKLGKKKYQTLTNVLHLINTIGTDPKSLDEKFATLDDEALFSEYCAFTAYDNKIKQSIIASCKAALSFMTDPAIQSVTNHNDFQFNELRQQRVFVFVNNKVSDSELYAPLVSVLYTQLFSYIMSEIPDPKTSQPIWLLIDEASSLTLDTLQIALANVRKHRAGIMLGIQDFKQLETKYGKDAIAIKSSCFSQVYFPGMSHIQSVELSAMLGKKDHKLENGTTRTLPLKTPDELRTMSTNEALILLGNNKPIIAKTRPFYKQRKLRKKTEYEAVNIELTKKGAQKRETKLFPLTGPDHVEE